jgi:hypothetical protein
MRPNHRARAFEQQRQDLGVVHREAKGTVPCIAQLIVPGQYSPGKLKRHQWYRREGKKNMSWALGNSVDPRRPDVVKAFKERTLWVHSTPIPSNGHNFTPELICVSSASC